MKRRVVQLESLGLDAVYGWLRESVSMCADVCGYVCVRARCEYVFLSVRPYAVNNYGIWHGMEQMNKYGRKTVAKRFTHTHEIQRTECQPAALVELTAKSSKGAKE